MSRSKFVSLLSEIANEVTRPGSAAHGGGRAASVWKALTIRALQSLPASSTPNHDTPFNHCQYPILRAVVLKRLSTMSC